MAGIQFHLLKMDADDSYEPVELDGIMVQPFEGNSYDGIHRYSIHSRTWQAR